MVITRLSGGLGNQLFQYAAGRALSIAGGVDQYLDTSLLDAASQGVTHREFALSEFRIRNKIATRSEVARLTFRNGTVWGMLARLACKAAPRRLRREYYEKSPRFDRNLLRAGRNVFIGGHWQSEKYFARFADTIRSEFRLRQPMSSAAASVAAEIASAASAVSVHIRRGDYASNEGAGKLHGVLPLDYYQKALAEVCRRVPDATFFVFSDEPDWVEKNFRLGVPLRIVADENKTDGEDLTLLSLCRHHIISNSSFSWWGAWLSNAPDKVVIAPIVWFADSSFDSADIVPSSWIRL